MFTAADLLEVLRQRRKRKSLRPETPGEFPPGWQAWLESMPVRVGAVVGAPPQAYLDLMAQRPPASPPRRGPQLTRGQAFATLWRQQWQPPLREQRTLRWFAIAFSALMHVLFAVLLLWVAYVRFMGLPPSVEGDTVVQVEFIGAGTPEEAGGGAPAGAQPQPAQARPASVAAPTPSPRVAMQPEAALAQPQLDVPLPPVELREVPEPQPRPPPVAAQPLQVTEVPAPDIEFAFPPATPRLPELPQPEIVAPELRAPTREIAVVDVPAPVVPVQRELPQREIAVPELRRRVPDVAVVDVPEPLPQVRARELPNRPQATPELRVPTLATAPREIPMPATADSKASPASTAVSSSADSRSAAPAPSAAPAGRAPVPGGRPAASSGTPPEATASGSGPAPTVRPGAWPTPGRADDWGDSTRNRPGERPGLFDREGRPQVSEDATADTLPGAAPGTVEQQLKDFDRAGRWMKRPPNDYSPTGLDRFWIPHENLLQEWVRKGIQEVAIPIPGTSKKLRCVVSLLQHGGGCGISDPNLNDQEATARPPPDIPYKPELQEDSGSR